VKKTAPIVPEEIAPPEAEATPTPSSRTTTKVEQRAKSSPAGATPDTEPPAAAPPAAPMTSTRGTLHDVTGRVLRFNFAPVPSDDLEEVLAQIELWLRNAVQLERVTRVARPAGDAHARWRREIHGAELEVAAKKLAAIGALVGPAEEPRS